MSTSSMSAMIGYLTEHEAQLVPHSNTVFLKHLIGVHRLLSQWQKSEKVCLAGLFHSVYGTEASEGFKLGLESRPEIEALIGIDAEQLVYHFCAFTAESVFNSIKNGETSICDRFQGRQICLTRAQFDDLLWLKLADVIEQGERWLRLGTPWATAGSSRHRHIESWLGRYPQGFRLRS